MSWPSWLPSFRTLLKWAGIGFIVLVLMSVRRQLFVILTPFVFAAILAYLLNPLVMKLQGYKLPRSLSILLVYCVFIFGLVMLGFYVIPAIVEEINVLIKQVPQLTIQLQEWILSFEERYGPVALPPAISEALEENLRTLQTWIVGMLSRSVEIVLDIAGKIVLVIMVPILSFYILRDLDLIKRSFMSLVPRHYRKNSLALFGRIDNALGNWVRGQLTVSLIVGVLTFIGLEIVGMDFALVLGFLQGIFNVIPYFGPIIGSVPALLLALLRSPAMFWRVLIVIVIIQQTESSYISPQVLGKRLQLHPLMIVFVLMLGAQFGGFLGLIFAVPLAAVVKVMVEYYLESRAD